MCVRIGCLFRNGFNSMLPSNLQTTQLKKIPKRYYSSKVVYIDDWYETIKKPIEFYEKFANGTPRRYFYNIDLQGRLFLEETFPKNVATSIKDTKFLNFFFSRIRRANGNDLDFLQEHSLQDDYPFLSKCGVETNFIRPAATPVVFHSLVDDTLFYGGSLKVPFESDRLAVSKNSGKVYYRIPTSDTNIAEKMEYGLICTSVGVLLSNKISIQENHDEKFLYDNLFEIDWLPSQCEPGKWAMPEEV